MSGVQDKQDNVEFTRLFSATNSGHCYLLEIDGVKILLDCGWSESFDPEILEPLRKLAPQVNLVLISFPDLEHMGALPYAVREFGLDATICLTRAAADLGILTLYDIYINESRTTKFDAFDLDDIDSLRLNFNEVNFEQPVRIDGSNLQVSVLRAGRTLGGGIWRIIREPEDIIYAVDFNHKKEKHLDGAALSSRMKPTVMITDAYNFNIRHLPRPKREEQLIEKILGHLRANGSVLLPVDSSGRVLELLLFLEQEWKKRKLNYPIVWANALVHSIVRHVKSHLEFMEEGLNKEFSRNRNNPFDFKHVKLVSSVNGVHQARDPKIVLTSFTSLEYGFVRELMVSFAMHRRNLLLLTNRCTMKSSLGRKLYEKIRAMEKLPFLNLERSRWEYYKDDELEQWRHLESERGTAEIRRKRQIEEAKALREELAGEADDLDFDLEAENEKNMNGKREIESGQGSLNALITGSKSRKLMFSAPETERFAKWSDYGMAIDESDFLDANKENEPSFKGETVEKEKIENLLGYDFGDPIKDCSLKRNLRARLPRRLKKDTQIVYFHCDTDYIDFEGRSDWRSIKIIIEKLRPQKLVVVNIDEDSVDHFKEEMEEMSELECIIPEVGVPQNVASDSGLWRIKIDRSLFDRELNPLYDESLYNTKSVKGIDVAYIEGIVKDITALGREYSLLEPIPQMQKSNYMRSIPESLISHGEISLLSLQDKFTNSGFETMFKDGVLVCNNNINIFKAKNNKLQVMGPLSKEYYEVRKLLYENYLLV